ncbi:MAG TPA: DNA primase, partial [Anaerolineales bacterium]|nr:DNA primase [Anaerolineales bacterium]
MKLMAAIDEIKARLDIVELVSETVQLRKAGKNYTGFCPFHPNTRTPAFVVFPDTQNWHCFGQCNEGGDIFNFVMKKDGLDFPGALRYLADRAGVRLEPLRSQEAEEKDEFDRLRTLLEESVTFYRHQLLETQAGRPALDYLRKRGLTDATIETFALGYAPDSWDALTDYLKEKGHPEEDLLACGLVSARDSGGVFDRFRNRIQFPIRDGSGRMAGFGARSLDPEDMPKYLNSPQTGLFDKSGLLYGLDRARKAIRKSDQAVIVEG